MSESTVMNDYTPVLFGRRTIYSSSDEITEENVVEQVNYALTFHVQNLLEEEKLYWYRRGLQPILNRTKAVRPDINNKIVENHAAEIVDFRNGWFLTQPIWYISRNESSADKVERLNEYMYRSGKQQVDNEVVDWFHTVGKGAIIIEPRDDDERPIAVYCLDPRSAFVVYSMRPGNEPVMGVNMVVQGENLVIDVFTRDKVFRLSGTAVGKLMTNDPTFVATAVSVNGVEPNVLGKVPIIEYSYNSVNMGAFESVIPILDAINLISSNQLDGIEQIIQSLLVLYNCDLEEGVTANAIKAAGLIKLRSVGENRADIKEISEKLDQTQTQAYKEYLYEQMLTICAMPTTQKGGRSTSDTGAAVLARDGWYQADCAARNTEDLFRKSNRYFDAIFIDILKRRGLLDIDIDDFEINFVRNETANVQSKAQAFQTLLAAGMHPELAAAKSGISNDPVSDIKMSEKYLKMIWGDPDKVDEAEQTDGGQGEAEIIEVDNYDGRSPTGGAV